jgi:glycosyltransferase involved in cell wall biosynthesis
LTGISVLILTRDEALDLPACLQSVAWSDDVHVLDSFSHDATVEIAVSSGARVTQRVFDDYASQRNAGLLLPFEHEWILTLDADERIPRELVSELLQFASTAPPEVAAARMRRRDIWWGRWLRHAQMSPFYVRLVRKGRARYERKVNEVLVADGAVQDLQHHFDHFPFSKGLDHWIAKHNTYSRMEADLIFRDRGPTPSLRIALFGVDFNERRLHQKAIFYRLPGRPIIKFMYLMVVRRAFLDGWPGVRYAILQAIYEYFIVLKTKELRGAATAITDRTAEPSSPLDGPSLAPRNPNEAP